MESDEGVSVNAAAVRTMMRLIEAYRNGSIRLFDLVNELEATLNGMLEVPVEWRSRFLDCWATLEEVNALDLDVGQTKPVTEQEQLVAKALDMVEQLITNAKATFAF